MNPEVKARWVKELRDPRRTQTTGRLADHKGMCCLGVLVDIEVDDDWVWSDRRGGYWRIGVDMDLPPLSLMDRVGLSLDAQDKLTWMNDNQHKSFAEIADWIEENL